MFSVQLRRIIAYLVLPLLLSVAALAESQRRAKLEKDRAQPNDRAEVEKEIDSIREQLRELEEKFMAVSAQDRAAYAEFLTGPDTGLIRLLPREKYEKKMTLRGGGAYYSFVRLTHEYGYGSDIELNGSQFRVGFAGADFGFLAALGETPIESITLEHPGVTYLASYTAPSDEPEAREQYRRGHPGFEVEGFRYSSSISALPGYTYVLRSIDYGSSDVLVAFHVVRQDKDGSMVLVWKLLKRFFAPNLAR